MLLARGLAVARVPARASAARAGAARGYAADPAQKRRDMRRKATTRDRRPAASDISTAPTCVARISNLPPGTSAADIGGLAAAPGGARAKIKALRFEFDHSLRPLRSARAVFFSDREAADFVAATNGTLFAGSRLRTDFVVNEVVPNPARDQYLGSAQGTVVFLYGYPQYMHQHQIRDYYRAYDIVDTMLPGVQPAPLDGATFLVRRGAFLVQLSTPAEARRFIRDVYGSTYTAKPEDWAGAGPDTPLPSAVEATGRQYVIKAILAN
ncbi:hypothetical protein H4R18_003194 [Coemansia javaensis]|uniref:RRM domain-containing protein n=1 Tax=Coemansia javaensis TaxID=2761396 RepID=A0A9W8LGP6_9FUNG|nr:hypothetical protein H4R18_003194 [Coemansia javaensis]